VKKARALAAGLALAPLLLAGLTGPVLANGVGDLYLASPAGVLEVRVSTSTVVSTIDVLPAPQSLAFTPDGKTLYAGSGGANVTPIDIETLNVGAVISAPGPVSALAFPAGQVLVGAMPTRRTLAFMTVHSGAVTESAELPGSGNILAGDRRDPRVAVAEAGKSWLDVVDPATSTAKKTTVAGEIQALAIDRQNGGVLVATANPNTLARIDLTTLTVDWTVDLPGTPTAVTAMAKQAVVAGQTEIWQVTPTKATPWAKTRSAVTTMAASDEGSFLHVAESGAVEVFDAAGKLARTLELGKDRDPVALAGVPAGSSLYLGESGKSTTAPAVGTPGAIVTQKPPPTGTFVDSAAEAIGYPPVQGALVVAVLILMAYWWLARWYDKQVKKRT
jgi:DNA-binding beta-propeller fold protein YncE